MNVNSPVHKVPFVGLTMVKRLKKLGIDSVLDLIYYFPFRYDDYSLTSPISQIQPAKGAVVIKVILPPKLKILRCSGIAFSGFLMKKNQFLFLENDLSELPAILLEILHPCKLQQLSFSSWIEKNYFPETLQRRLSAVIKNTGI